jgi:hypothetical protein
MNEASGSGTLRIPSSAQFSICFCTTLRLDWQLSGLETGNLQSIDFLPCKQWAFRAASPSCSCGEYRDITIQYAIRSPKGAADRGNLSLQGILYTVAIGIPESSPAASTPEVSSVTLTREAFPAAELSPSAEGPEPAVLLEADTLMVRRAIFFLRSLHRLWASRSFARHCSHLLLVPRKKLQCFHALQREHH